MVQRQAALLVALLVPFLAAIPTNLNARRTAPRNNHEITQQWLEWLDSPPQQALDAFEQVSRNADKLVASLLQSTPTLAVPSDVDVVISGGGFLDSYYFGGAQILSRVQQHGDLHLHRFAGASAGGEAPFQWQLTGEKRTVQSHMSFGVLQEKFASTFAFLPDALYLQDHEWRTLADWMMDNFDDKLHQLNGVVTVALSCLDPLPKLVLVSNFTSKDQAKSAFIGTGTVFEEYEGMPCSDGGAMSGKKMTPLFQDNKRAQIIVDLMETGRPISGVYRYNVTEAVSLFLQGQEEMVEFLKTGTCRADAITLCPVGSKVDKNICEKSV